MMIIVLSCQALLDDSYNTDHVIITDTGYEVGGKVHYIMVIVVLQRCSQE